MTGLPERLRSTARQAARPVWLKFRGRVEALITERLAPAIAESHRVDVELHLRADEAQQQIHVLSTDLAEGMRDTDRRLREIAAGLEWLDHEHRRIAPQLAAVEARLAELERRAARPTPGPDTEVTDPTLTALVDELRAEHSRVRARLGTVTRYEERLARLEAAAD